MCDTQSPHLIFTEKELCYAYKFKFSEGDKRGNDAGYLVRNKASNKIK